jgi:AcrR family transcriptional regulator
MLAARSRRARSTRRGETSRGQILQAAVDLLTERGYAGLSISGICAKADIAPTSLYWHFGSKAGLMEAVLDRIAGGHVDRIRASVARAAEPLERLDRLIVGLRELVTTQPLGSLTGVAIVGEGRHVTEELAGALQSARQRELEVIATDLEAELGGTAAQAHSLAIVVIACTNYAALTYQIARDKLEVDRVLEALRETILRVANPG